MSMTELAEQEVARAAYEREKLRILYEEPVPIIPYPHKGKEVTPYGFVRDQLNLPQKVLKNLGGSPTRMNAQDLFSEPDSSFLGRSMDSRTGPDSP